MSMPEEETNANPPAEGSPPASDPGFVPVETAAGAAEQPQADGSAAPAPEDGGPEEGTEKREEAPQAPAWAEVPTTAELLEHEAVKPDVDRIREEATDEGRSSMQKQLQPLLQGQREHYAKVAKGAEEFSADWQDLVAGEGRLDPDDVQKLLRRHGDALQAIQGAHYSQGAEWGGSALLGEMGKAAGMDNADLEGINRQLLYAFQQRWRGESPDMSFAKDFVTRATKVVKAEAFEAGKKEGSKMTEARIKTEAAAEKRNGQPTAAATGGRGAAAGSKVFKSMTFEEQGQQTAADRDAETKAFIEANS